MNVGDVVQLKSGGPLMTMIRHELSGTKDPDKAAEILCGGSIRTGKTTNTRCSFSRWMPCETSLKRLEATRRAQVQHGSQSPHQFHKVWPSAGLKLFYGTDT